MIMDKLLIYLSRIACMYQMYLCAYLVPNKSRNRQNAQMMVFMPLRTKDCLSLKATMSRYHTTNAADYPYSQPAPAYSASWIAHGFCKDSAACTPRSVSQKHRQVRASDMPGLSVWESALSKSTFDSRNYWCWQFTPWWLHFLWSTRVKHPWNDTYLERQNSIKHYKAATIFINHASRFIHLSICVNQLEQPKPYWQNCILRNWQRTVGSNLWHFWSDNGVFASNSFKQSLTTAGQDITLCRVNAHFQNGIAECSIRTIFDRAWTMLLHAIEKWPDDITIDLWSCPCTLPSTSTMLPQLKVDCCPRKYSHGKRERTIWISFTLLVALFSFWNPACNKDRNTKMEAKVSNGCLPGPLAPACPNCTPGPQPSFWSHLTSIPCGIWQPVYHNNQQENK